MYTQSSITYQLAEARRRDMLVAAERASLAREAKSLARASRPSASRRRIWPLVGQLRPQAQS